LLAEQGVDVSLVSRGNWTFEAGRQFVRWGKADDHERPGDRTTDIVRPGDPRAEGGGDAPGRLCIEPEVRGISEKTAMEQLVPLLKAATASADRLGTMEYYLLSRKKGVSVSRGRAPPFSPASRRRGTPSSCSTACPWAAARL
jgi:hypothetical protein